MSEVYSVTEKVAIVILNWNGQNYLEQFLPALIKNSVSDSTKIYIADNGSADNSVTFLKENYPTIELILFDKNHGFTGGYNRALELINAEYFVILNSDVEVTSNWLEPVIHFMDQNKDVAACQPKIRSFARKEYFEYAGATGGFIDKYGYPFCRGRIIGMLEKDDGQYDDIKEIFWATGACMFVRADLFKTIGGFDEDFFAHMEEIDLCWRLKNLGYKIYFHPESTVFHVGGGALPNDSPRKLYLQYRNNLFLLCKNLNSSQLFSILSKRLILDGISAIMYLVAFKLSLFIVVFKAHISFYKVVSEMRQKRSQQSLKTEQIKEVYPKSIVFDYFIKKRRYFRDLNF